MLHCNIGYALDGFQYDDMRKMQLRITLDSNQE